MNEELKKWNVILITPDKTLRGDITALPPPLDSRTISILNHLKNMNIDGVVIPKDFVRLENAVVANRTGPPLEYESLLVRKSDIVLAYDGFEKMGQDSERQRQSKITVNKSANIELILRAIGFNTWYRIFGNASNYNSKMEKDMFIPLTDVTLEKVVTVAASSKTESGLEETFKVHTGDPVGFSFLAVNKDYIQAYSQS